MKAIVADTNAFLRVFLDDIPKQKKIFEKLLEKAKGKQVLLLVPQIVIFEIEFILRKSYHVPKEEIIEKLHSLISASYLEVESRNIFLSALPLFKNNTISLVDSFLFSKAKARDAELFSFDEKLKKLL